MSRLSNHCILHNTTVSYVIPSSFPISPPFGSTSCACCAKTVTYRKRLRDEARFDPLILRFRTKVSDSLGEGVNIDRKACRLFREPLWSYCIVGSIPWSWTSKTIPLKKPASCPRISNLGGGYNPIRRRKLLFRSKTFRKSPHKNTIVIAKSPEKFPHLGDPTQSSCLHGIAVSFEFTTDSLSRYGSHCHRHSHCEHQNHKLYVNIFPKHPKLSKSVLWAQRQRYNVHEDWS